MGFLANAAFFMRSGSSFDMGEQPWKFSHQTSLADAINRYSSYANWQDAHLQDSWSKLNLDSTVEDGWYRCFLHIKDNRPQDKAVYLRQVALAHKVYVNGNLIGESGSFTRKRYDFTKQRLYGIPNALWQKGDNLITIHLDGHSLSTSGIRQALIVDEQYMARWLIIGDIPKIFLSLAYILLAVVLGLFYIAPNQKETLYIGLLSLFFGFYYLLQTWARYEIFSSFSYVVELTLLFCCMPLAFEYFSRIVFSKRHKYIYSIYGLSGILVILVIVLPSSPMTWNYLVKANIAVSVLYFIFFIALYKGFLGKGKNIVNLREKERDFSYFKKSAIIIFLCLFSDSLASMGVHNLANLLPIGLFVFICTALLQIPKDIVRVYNTMLASEKQTRLVEKRKTESIYSMSRKFDSSLQSLYLFAQSCAKNLSATPRLFQKNKNSLHKSILSLESLVHSNELIRSLEAGSYIPKLNTLRIIELCQTTVERALVATEQKKKRIKLNVKHQETLIMLDTNLLSVAFYHIVENALLYTEGKVECNIEFVGNELKMQIIDEGPGLDMEKADKLFEKFHRFVEPNSKISGLGVGLALVSLAMKHIGGRVVFNANHGFFSDFSLFVPVR